LARRTAKTAALFSFLDCFPPTPDVDFSAKGAEICCSANGAESAAAPPARNIKAWGKR
jgi:hypothetical protein